MALKGGWWRMILRMQWYMVGLAAVLAAFRLALPYVVERYVNHQLNQEKDYGGRIGAVHIQLWRGSYQIDELKYTKGAGPYMSRCLPRTTRIYP